MRLIAGLQGLAAVSLIAATAVIVVSGSPSAATAASTDLMNCTGTQTTYYDPGLLVAEQSVRKSGANDWPVCTGTGSEIESASSEFDAQITASCASPLGTGEGSQIIEWSDDTESTFEWTATRSLTPVSAITVVVGSITAGTFAGSHAVLTIVAPLFNPLQCLAPPGVTEDIGDSTLVITQV